MSPKTIGVAGLGLLGRGIAACLLGHGFRVVAFTRQESTHAEARNYIQRAIHDLIRRAGFSPSLADEWPQRFVPALACEPLAECEFVIESIVEDLAAKEEFFDRLELLLDSAAPIASNTSALPISQLQRGRKRPQRFLGMHWAEPAHVTRFMEIVRGEQTSDAALGAAVALAKAIGKEPSLVLKDLPAFIVNRLGYAMYREAIHLLEMGVADAETIDRSFRNAVGMWATMCGPFRWVDLTGGPALYAKAMAGVWPTLSNATAVSGLIQALADADARGIANGRGFYNYTEEEARRWEELFLEHAWTVRELLNNYFPVMPPPAIDSLSAGGASS